MKIDIIILMSLLNYSYSFNQNFVVKRRNSIITNSHFSRVNTELKDKDILIKSILDVSENVVYSDIPSLVKGYNNEKVLADIVIKQKNGKDIGFCLKDGSYDIVTDLQFWDQKVPVEVFLEKISQRYAYNSVIRNCEEGGFVTNYVKNDLKNGCIEIEVSKYDV
tara:strand:- start:66 stop:557 length:492 start_codon:yes stop_codon:yes gene_type:complete